MPAHVVAASRRSGQVNAPAAAGVQPGVASSRRPSAARSGRRTRVQARSKRGTDRLPHLRRTQESILVTAKQASGPGHLGGDEDVLGREALSLGQPFLRVRSTEESGNLGAQAGENRLHRVASEAGLYRFRRVAETPFNLVFELRP
jgi:hypothetical protein